MTVVVNHDTGVVVWCHDGHGRKVFDAFLEQLGEEGRASIELVSADGARWVDDAMAEWVPNATRCVDTFHVVQWATDLLDEVRRQAWRDAAAKAKAAPRRGRGRPKMYLIA